jgi:hypothetical protein
LANRYRKNESLKTKHTGYRTPSSEIQESEVYFVVDGLDPIYLGDLDPLVAIDFCYEMEDLGITYNIDKSIVALAEEKNSRVRANGRSEDTIESIKTLSRDAFDSEADIDLATYIPRAIQASDKVFNNPKRKMRSDECSLGRHMGKEITYPISVREVEDISVEEAGVNLAFCFPSFIYNENLKVPLSALMEFETKRYISQEFIDSLPSKDRTTIKRITQTLTEKFFKSNAKLEKQYVPSEMGIGEPSEISGYNIAPTLGSEGLNLTNANSLFGGESTTGMPAVRDILKKHLEKLKKGEYSKHWYTLKGESGEKKHTRDSDFSKRLGICLETLLEALDGFGESNDCCTNKSKGCYSNCLTFSGRRNSITNIFKEKTALAEGQSRMLGAYLHTTFLANPYYFLRLMIHATYQHVAKHTNELCMHNSNARYDNDLKVIDNVDEYMKTLPPSLRLNVYSDYIWEKIYSDYFDLFDLKKPKQFAKYGKASVMFYDYTKHPTRWSTAQRKKLFDEVGIEWNDKYKYDLPSNYHLTFSFSGTKASFISSQICGLAGQNATYVFSSTSITSTAVDWALKNTKQVFGGLGGDNVKTAFDTLNTKLKKTLTEYFGANFETASTQSLQYSGSGSLRTHGNLQYTELLPASYFGIPVVSGDLYDLRYLDRYKQKDGESVIVGLAWKTPNNVKINVNGTSKALEPSICAMFLKNQGNTDVGVGFGIPRYLLGQAINFTVDDVPKVLTMYVVAKSPKRQDAQSAIEDLASIDVESTFTQDRLDEFKISSATETGAVMNVPIGSNTVQFMVVDAVDKALSKL